MPNINKQYQNLASKGRYGDTMLAHINPQEAGLLRSMGGSGTINPQTGLPEFYHHFEKGMGAYGMLPQKYPQMQINAMSMPVLAQALDADEFKNIAPRLKTTEVPPEWIGMGTTRAGYSKVNPEYGQYARFGEYTGMGQGGELVKYEIPIDKTFQGKPLVAIYDAQGNFKHVTLSPESYLTPDPNQPNIIAQPKFNLSGGIVDYGVGDTSANKGGFGEMIGGMVSDLSPIILAALAGNAAAGNLSGLFGGGGAGAAAGAGGNAGALINAGMGGSAAQAASAAANLATTTAGLDAAIAAGGGLVPNVAANFMSPDVIAGAGGASGAGGAATTGMLSGAPAVTPTPAPPVGAPPVAGAGAGAGTGVTSSVLSAISKATGIPLDTLKTFAPSVIQGLIGAGGSYLQSEQAKEAAQTQADALPETHDYEPVLTGFVGTVQE